MASAMRAACTGQDLLLKQLHFQEPRGREELHDASTCGPIRGLKRASVGAHIHCRGSGTILQHRRLGRRRHLRHTACSVAAPEAPDSVSPPTQNPSNNDGPVVVIDNYDSFTYNLCQYLGDLGCEHIVFRNDEISIAELRDMGPRGILISPGPGTPEDSGISLETVKELGPTVPLFGVCMGLQCIGQAFGGRIVRAPHGVMHGKTSPVYHNQTGQESGLLVGLNNPFTAARYHSLVIERETFPEDELEITAWTEDGLVMGARHRKYPHIEGVQFHPESIITQNGKQIVNNFILKLALLPASSDSL